MTSGADPRPDRAIKLLLTGDSGTGKSGGRVPLLLDGYKLRDIDLDNKIDIILHLLQHPKSPYFAAVQKLNLAEAYRYETVNHKMITMDTGKRVRIQPNAATVWPRMEKLIHEWREECGVYLGPISSWGPDTILTIDSFTFAGFAALFYIQELNNTLGADPSGNTWRRNIGMAQDHMDTVLKLLCSDAVKCHVIVTTHINYLTESWQKDSDDRTAPAVKQISTFASDAFGTVSRAYPNAIGRALGPRIGAYFNNVLEAKIEGPISKPRRRIYTVPTGAIAVKTSAPYALKESYDISTGLAEIFYAIRGTKPSQPTKEVPNESKPLQPKEISP